MAGRVSLARAILRNMLLSAVLCLPGKSLFAVSCSVVKHPAPSLADMALLGPNMSRPRALPGRVTQPSGDAELTMGLVHGCCISRSCRKPWMR